MILCWPNKISFTCSIVIPMEKNKNLINMIYKNTWNIFRYHGNKTMSYIPFSTVLENKQIKINTCLLAVINVDYWFLRCCTDQYLRYCLLFINFIHWYNHADIRINFEKNIIYPFLLKLSPTGCFSKFTTKYLSFFTTILVGLNNNLTVYNVLTPIE